MINQWVLSNNEEKNKRKTLSWMISLVIILSFCIIPVYGELQNDPSTPWPRTIQDDQQQTVVLQSPPERIVSLAPSNTEVLFALGLDDRIVGVTDYCDYPQLALEKSTIGGFSTVSIEKVIALEPDLVVSSSGNNQETIDRVKDLGIPVYYVDAENLDGIYRNFENLGFITGTSDKALKIVSSLKEREEKVREAGASLSDKPIVAHVIWYDPIYVSGKDTFQDELIQIAGGVNAFSDKQSHAIANIEEFINKNPDILMINSGSGMGGNSSEIIEYFKNEPRLSGLSAITSDNIIIVESSVADRAGPRLWDLLEEIAPKIRKE